MIHSSRYAHMGEVISINRTSVLVKTTSESGGKLVVKSYRPSDFLREKELHLGLPPVTMDGGYRRSPGHYWEKEAAVLEILTDSQQEGRTVVRVPTFYSKDPEDLTIAMEYLDLPVLSDELAKYESDEDKQPFRERQLQEVGGLQLALNHINNAGRLTELRSSFSNQGYKPRKVINFRDYREEIQRLSLQLRLLAFTHSDAVRSRFGIDDQWKYTTDSWGLFKKNVSAYLSERGINFQDFVRKAVERHEKIIYGDKSPYGKIGDLRSLITSKKVILVHGDAGPQNTFYDQYSPWRFGDWNEVRLANRHLDLVHALYHTSNDPSELAALHLLSDYFREEPQQEEEKGDLSLFLLRIIETRLMENMRWIASDARRSVADTRRIFGPTSERLNDLQVKSYNLSRFSKFSRFYVRDQGRDVLVSGQTLEHRLMLEQLSAFERLFHALEIPDISDYALKVAELSGTG